MEDFNKRLKIAMSNRNINQAKLSKLSGISKPLISNYLSGKYKAKQDNLYIIAKILNVNEAWLMGFDVDMERTNIDEPFLMPTDTKRFKKGDVVSMQQLIDYISELQNKIDKIKENL